MGTGAKLKCLECGEEFNLHFGIGFLYPQEIKEMRQNTLNGKLGSEWQTLLKENKYRLVETREYLFYCEHCLSNL